MPGWDIVHRQLWNSASFRALPEDGRALFLYLLTCPHRNSFGYFVLPAEYGAADLQWSAQRYQAAWEALEAVGMACRDEACRTVLICNALRFNKPANPNIVKRWRELVELLPRTALLVRLVALAGEHLPETWQRAWLNGYQPLDEAAINPLPNPFETVALTLSKSQSQSQSQSLIPNPIPSPSLSTPPQPHPTPKERGTHTHAKITLGEFGNVLLTPKELVKLNERFGKEGARQRIEELSEGLESKGYKYKSHYATILSWERLHLKKGETDGKSRPDSRQGLPGNKPAGAFADLE